MAETPEIDLATERVYQALIASEHRRAFINEIDQAPPPLVGDIPACVTVAVIPGLFWVENPGTGADGHFVIEAMAKLGCKAQRVVVPSMGTLAGNARILCDWLLGRPPTERIVLVALSKGSCDVKLALAEPDAAQAFSRVIGWVSLAGALHGTPISTWLSARPLVKASVALKCWYWGYTLEGLMEIARGPGHPLSAPLVVPDHIRVVHVAGYPNTTDLSLPMSRLGHRRLSPMGPNDGLMMLADMADLPGEIYPIRGSDHFLRTMREGGTLIERLVHWVVKGAGRIEDKTAATFEARPSNADRLVSAAPADMPIPDRLNRILVVGVTGLAVFLLWLGSHVTHPAALALVAVAFSYLMLTDYALVHEAAHDNLQTDPRLNYVGGLLSGLLFPVPFSMLRIHHRGHHLRNRTDFEMFDLYDPDDSRFMKLFVWYGTLCGAMWPAAPLLGALFAVWPGVLRIRLLNDYRPYRNFLKDIRDIEIRSIRMEMALIVALFAGLAVLLDLRLGPTLLLYCCFGLNWSTRQYVGHAFSRRNVSDGAFNLRHSPLMTALLLNGTLDLNHHRRPDVPWIHLPRITRTDEPLIPYVRQYLRMWLGPRANLEPAPEALQVLPISVHAEA